MSYRAGDFLSRQKARLQERTEAKQKAWAISEELAEHLRQEQEIKDRSKRMSIVEPSGSGGVPEIADGLYTATIKGIEGRTLDAPDAFGKTEKLVIEIEFPDSDGDYQLLHPWVNRAWSKGANLFKIAEACGLEVSPAVAFDTNALIGRQVNVLIETVEEGRWPRVTKWSKVPTRLTGKSMKAFWDAAAAKGFSQQAIRDLVADEFECEPHQLTGEQREAVLAGL